MTRLVDAHCHVDLFPAPPQLLAAASRGEGCHLIAVTNAPSVFEHTLELSHQYPTVHAALGLHPQLVKTRSGELDLLRGLLERTRFVGEVGLDYQTRDEAERSLQREVFSKVVDACTMLGDRVLSIHSRRSSKDVLAILGATFRGTAILHYFSGSKREVASASSRGFFFSVNPAMIRSKSGQALIRCMEPDLVLTESDGPFVKYGKRPAEPRDVSVVLKYLSETWSCSLEDAAARVSANFERAVGS